LTPFQKAYFHFLNAYKCNATVSQCSLYKVQKPYANPDPASTLFLRQFFLQPLGMENLSFARREGVAFIVGSSTMVWSWRVCIARREGVAFIIGSSTMVWRVVGYS
jgi:hypothetical protein